MPPSRGTKPPAAINNPTEAAGELRESRRAKKGHSIDAWLREFGFSIVRRDEVDTIWKRRRHGGQQHIYYMQSEAVALAESLDNKAKEELESKSTRE